MDFYKILLEIMEEKSFSIPDVARATRLSDSTIRSIISRKTKKVSLDVAFKMHKGLGVSLERLNGEEIKNTSKNNNLSQEETTLLENFNKLDGYDKGKVIDYTRDLSNNIKYMNSEFSDELAATKEDIKFVELPKKEKQIWEESGKEHLMPIASHDRDGKFTDEEYDHDDDLMDNEDFWK